MANNYGIILIFFATATGEGCTIQRSPDGSTWSNLSTLPLLSPSGTPFVDQLPNDGVQRYYRCKATAPGFLDSDWSDTANAAPAQIPDGLDLSQLPWLYNNTLNLILVMTVIAEDPTTLTVSSSVNQDPAHLGTPTVSLVGYSGLASAPTNIGLGTWEIDKPPTGSARISFMNTLAGRQPGLDAFDVQMADLTSPGQFLNLFMTPVNSTATSVTYSLSATNANSNPIGFFVSSSSGVTVNWLSSTEAAIARPTVVNQGLVIFGVTSSTAGIVADYDELYIPQNNLASLVAQMAVTTVFTSSFSGSFTVTDPYTTTGAIGGLTITYSTQSASLTGMSWSTGSATNTGGVFTQPFVVNRQNYGQGTGRFSGTATKTGMGEAGDSIEVIERVDGIAHLTCFAQTTINGTDTVTVVVSGSDSLGLVVPTISLPQIQPAGSVSYSGTFPTYVINRPIAGSVTVMFSASAANRVSDEAMITVTSNAAALDISSFIELTLTETTTTATEVIVSASCIAHGNPINISMYTSSNDGGYTGTNPYTITRPATGVATYTFLATSSAAGIINDTKQHFVSSTNQTVLNVLAIPQSSSATAIIVDVSVYDPLNTTTYLSGITMTESDTGNGGLSVTDIEEFNYIGEYIYRYSITRPTPGTGTARVTFKATKTGYTPDADSVDVPEAAIRTLICSAQDISATGTTVTVAATGSDYVAAGGPPTLTVNSNGLTVGSPSTTTSGSTIFSTYVVTRPATYATGLSFTAAKSGVNSTTCTPVSIGAVTSSGGGGGGTDCRVNAVWVDSSNWGSNYEIVKWTVTNPPAGGSYNLSSLAYWNGSSTGSVVGSVSSVTSPYDYGGGNLGATLGKGTGWKTFQVTYYLTVKDSGGNNVATGTSPIYNDDGVFTP